MADYFSFQEALTKLRQGRKVTRKKNDRFIFDGEHHRIEYMLLRDDEVWVKPECKTTPCPMRELRMWLSMEDMFAEDWYEVKTNDEES